MKKILIGLCIIILWSCESSENKYSRLTIDKYTRKLNSIIDNIVLSRNDEGTQTILSLNSFYQRYTDQIESYSNDLNFETISIDYLPYRDKLILIANDVKYYLVCRKSAVRNLSEANSYYQSMLQNINDHLNYKAQQRNAFRSLNSAALSFYGNLSINSLYDLSKNLEDFHDYKNAFLCDVEILDLAYQDLNLEIGIFNIKLKDTKLVDTLILPPIFFDTINDWVLNNVTFMSNLKITEEQMELLRSN